MFSWVTALWKFQHFNLVTKVSQILLGASSVRVKKLWAYSVSETPALIMFYCPLPFRRKARGHGIWLSVVHDAWFWVCRRYRVSATPPTVLDQSFWNFTGVLIMVWRHACAFYRILNLFFFSLFHVFNLDFFAWLRVCSGKFVSATHPTVLYRSFWNFTGILIMVWKYACAFYRILKFFFFQIFHIFNLDFFFNVSILWKCICSRYLVSATPPIVLYHSHWNWQMFWP